ncbi:MAG: MaoC family dehydratase N-terminal domain-containing protein [Chloroflexi bacterium]|nr:MaoC family dehydratase N-terminal domain-containing protein [Chloroflexota bacterium]
MTQATTSLEGVKKAIGTKGKAVSTEVEKGAVRRFAEAIDDPNPLWTDGAHARKTRYGSIIAPPTFLRSLPKDDPRDRLMKEIPYKRGLDAGSEWEYFEPVRPGDIITSITTLTDIFERAGRLGPMLFLIVKTTYKNQLRRVVATQRSTRIVY